MLLLAATGALDSRMQVHWGYEYLCSLWTTLSRFIGSGECLGGYHVSGLPPGLRPGRGTNVHNPVGPKPGKHGKYAMEAYLTRAVLFL